MASDFSVPRWLEPPNEIERARIDEATTAAQQKAGTMIRKAIGMRRMQAEAQAAIANGVDPVTANQNALLNNAELLFSDNPKAVADFTNREEANQVRERANLQLNQHREMQDVLRGQMNKIVQERDEQRAKHQTELEKASQEKLGLGYENLSLKQKLGEEEMQRKKDAAEALDLRSKLTQKRLQEQGDRNARIRIEQILQTDTNYMDLVGKVTAARKEAAKAHQSTGKTLGIFGYSPEEVKKADTALAKAEKDLQDYRIKTGNRFNIDMAPDAEESDQGGGDTETESPYKQPSASKRFKWTPNGLVPIE